MSTNHPPTDASKTRTAANDNGRKKLRVHVQIPRNLPITQAEIEVVSALLNDLIQNAANDNEGREDDKASGGLCTGLDDSTGRE